jgi:putative peptidoglycan lipid II flippase
MLVVSGGVLLSRVFGLVRDVVFASTWGTSTAFAAFVIAFTIPNILRALFGEGAFSAAFVPTFTKTLEEEGEGAAWSSAQRIVTVLGVVLLAIIGVVVIACLIARPLLTRELDVLIARLLPWVMPYAALICVTGALSGVLNSMRRFALPAVTPVLLNATLILTALFVAPLWTETSQDGVLVLAIAVLLAGVLQLGLQLVGCGKLGLRFRAEFAPRSADVRHVTMLMAPALLGTGVAQINVGVDRFLARCLGADATGALYYSQRLVYLPVGLFGVAMAVVSLPALSRAWAKGDRVDMVQSLTYALRMVLFLTLPTLAILAVLSEPIVQLLFQRGSFTAQSTQHTLWALWFYLPGIPAFACAKIAVTPFYAKHDTKTPVKIAAVCLVLNVILNLVLMQFLKQGGLALATALCSWLNVTLLLRCTRREIGGIGGRRLGLSVLKSSAAALSAGAACMLGRQLAAPLVASVSDQSLLLGRAIAVLLPLATGGLAFVAAAGLLRCPELGDLLKTVLKKFGRDDR